KHAKHKQNQKLNQQQTSTKSSLQNYMTSPARDAHNSAQKAHVNHKTTSFLTLVKSQPNTALIR
ncbi:hypothetical protein ACVBEJ_13840, partial [Porticoccus sp. GXU_MW_L64]